MGKLKSRLREMITRKKVIVDKGFSCCFSNREECLEYLKRYFDPEFSLFLSEEVRHGRIRANKEIQNLIELKCGKKMMENMRAIQFLPCKRNNKKGIVV